MRIEEIIKTTFPMAQEKKALLNVMYTQNVIADQFNELLKTV